MKRRSEREERVEAESVTMSRLKKHVRKLSSLSKRVLAIKPHFFCSHTPRRNCPESYTHVLTTNPPIFRLKYPFQNPSWASRTCTLSLSNPPFFGSYQVFPLKKLSWVSRTRKQVLTIKPHSSAQAPPRRPSKAARPPRHPTPCTNRVTKEMMFPRADFAVGMVVFTAAWSPRADLTFLCEGEIVGVELC